VREVGVKYSCEPCRGIYGVIDASNPTCSHYPKGRPVVSREKTYGCRRELVGSDRCGDHGGSALCADCRTKKERAEKRRARKGARR
jgi:hypothetical protein